MTIIVTKTVTDRSYQNVIVSVSIYIARTCDREAGPVALVLPQE